MASMNDDALSDMNAKALLSRWRTGTKVGRTIYACFGARPMDDMDVLIGVMDTSELAQEAVRSHNALLRSVFMAEDPDEEPLD